MANVILDGVTYNGVDKVSLKDADNAGQRVEFVPTPTLITKNITANGTYNASSDNADGYSSVTVNVQQETVVEKDVNFYDYDGTLVASYTAADFANLTAMPANPTHTGLVAQGWNWSLSDAKTYVASYGKLNIGQMYATASGKTEYDIILDKTTGLTINHRFGGDSTDWGDGTVDSSSNHTYASYGKYTIKFTCTTAPLLTTGATYSSTSSPVAVAIRLGQGITWANNRIESPRLKSITISNTVADTQKAGGCFALQSITLPIGFQPSTYELEECSSLKTICLPSSITSIPSSFLKNGFALQSITIPSSVTSIGNYAFQYCKSLQSITIPSSITNIESQSMQYMNNARKVWIYATTPPTLGSTTGMPPNVTTIYIPNGTLTAYQTTTNWSSFSSKFVEMPA